MLHLRQIAMVLTPCCLLAGCASVPELPAVTAMHPAHPDAQAALIADRPSILDAMGAQAVAQPDAMDAEEMDHSHHHMSMGDGEQDQPEKDAGEMDHSHHSMSMGDGEQDQPEKSDHGDHHETPNHGGEDES